MSKHLFSWRGLARFGLLMFLLCPGGELLIAQNADRAAEILEALDEDYRVLRSADGFVLVPEVREEGPQLIEIGDGLVATDGLVVDEEGLEELVGDEASMMLELARLEDGLGVIDLLEPPASPEPPELAEDLDSLEDPEEPEESEDSEEPEEPRRQRGVIRTDTRVSFGSGLTVERNEQALDVVVFGGELIVLGQVRGDVVAFGGPVLVEGEVYGDVMAIGGPVELTSTAVVNGEVPSMGGDVIRDPDSQIRGVVTELSGGPMFNFEDLDIDLDAWDWPGGWFGYNGNDRHNRIGNTIVLSIVILGLLLLSGNLVPRIANRVKAEPWKSALVGLLVQVLFLPVVGLVCILLLISVVGIPLAVLILPLSLVLLVIFFFLGYAGVAMVAGRWLSYRFDREVTNNYVLVLLGIVLIQGWSIIGEELSFLPWPIKLTAVLLMIGGFLLKYVAWTVGLGAIVLKAFGPKAMPPPIPAWTDPGDDDTYLVDDFKEDGLGSDQSESDWTGSSYDTVPSPKIEAGSPETGGDNPEAEEASEATDDRAAQDEAGGQDESDAQDVADAQDKSSSDDDEERRKEK